MKKKFKDTKLGKLSKSKGGKIIGSFISGSLSTIFKPAAGAIAGLSEGIKQVKQDNLNSELGGQGKVNWIHLIGVSVSVLLLVGYMFDYITIEKFEYATEFIKELLDL